MTTSAESRETHCNKACAANDSDYSKPSWYARRTTHYTGVITFWSGLSVDWHSFSEKITLFVVIFSSYSFIGETMSTRSALSYCRGHMAQAQIYRQSATFFVCYTLWNTKPGNLTTATASGVGERQFTETNARYLVYTTDCWALAKNKKNNKKKQTSRSMKNWERIGVSLFSDALNLSDLLAWKASKDVKIWAITKYLYTTYWFVSSSNIGNRLGVGIE